MCILTKNVTTFARYNGASGYPQSPQRSDEQDKKFGIYYDLFLDSVDIHDRAKRHNAYGPILFVINVKKLIDLDIASLWITKANPLYWDATDDHSRRWFELIDEVENDFVVGRFN